MTTRPTGRPPLSPEVRKRTLSVRVRPTTIELLDRATDQLGLSRGEITELALRQFLRWE